MSDFSTSDTSTGDTYNGNVTVGGPSQQRKLPGVRITKVAVGPMDNNAYLIFAEGSGDVLLIDAADEMQRLIEETGTDRLVKVVTTHNHPDHWQALEAVVGITGASTVASAADEDGLPIPVREIVGDGDMVSVGDVTLGVISLVGHTPGSIALHLDLSTAGAGHHLFTGDSLFPGGPGGTTSPADFTSLMDDLERKVFGVLPDETWIYPGHGADTTLGAERPSLPEWRARGW
ncbi:MAG: MBL fold metallo-hydrolase [Frankiaceae bacterium]